MTAKKYWEKVILEFVSKLQTIKKEEEFTIDKHSFVAFPGVFSPAYSSDTKWFATKIKKYVKNASFLEIGTGTGAIACLAALNGATKIVATDINLSAVKNTLHNQKLHGLKFSVRQGSDFNPIKNNELFDVIFWNHPFGYAENKNLEKNMLLASVFDYKYRSLKKFLKKSKKHLAYQGKVFLGSSNVARVNLIKKLAKTEGYTCVLLNKAIVPAFKNKKTKIDVRLYVLIPINVK